MTNYKITDEQWPLIVEFLRNHPGVYVGQEDECRRFVEALLWVAQTGAQWREVPKQFGKWNSVYKRYLRWFGKDIWRRMHELFAQEALSI